MQSFDQRLTFEAAEPHAVLIHPFAFIVHELVIHLSRLCSNNKALLIVEKRMRQPGILFKHSIEFVLFLCRIDVRRREKLNSVIDHRVNLLIHLFLRDGQHLLKIAMNRCLQYLVTLEASQLAEIDVNQRGRG